MNPILLHLNQILLLWLESWRPSWKSTIRKEKNKQIALLFVALNHSLLKILKTAAKLDELPQ